VGGAGAALAASLALGLLGAVVFREISTAAREAFEGIVILVAVAVLFFTSFWLISRVEGRRWAAFVKREIEDAVSGGRARAVVGLAFLVVFREGAETVLMYVSLFAGQPGAAGQIVAGMGLAALALVGVFVASIVIGARLPVRPFFAISGALLYLLAFKFAGDGVSELQAGNLVSYTALDWIPKSRLLQDWFGIRPSVETCALQAVLLLAVFVGVFWTIARRPAAEVVPG